MMLLVFLLSAGASFSIWFFLRGQETRRARTQLSQAASSLQDRVQAELDSEVSALQRLAAKWQIRPEMSRLEWEYDVRQMLEQHPSLLSVAWMENPPGPGAWRINWSLPTVYEPAILKLHNLIEENRPDLLTAVVRDRRIRISEPIVVADRGKAFAVYVPSVVDGRLKGALLGVFHLQVLLDFVFDRLLSTDYTVQLLDGYQTIYSRGLPKNASFDWEHASTLDVFSSRWQLRMWPNPELQRANERLADMMLFGGLIVSSLLTLLVYFAGSRPARNQMRVVAGSPEPSAPSEDRLALLEAVFAPLSQPVFVAEPEVVLGTGPVLRYVNPALCELTGYQPSELLGKSPRLLFSGEFLSAGRFTAEATLPVQLKSGESLDRILHAQPVFDEEARQIRFWVITLSEPAQPQGPSPLEALLNDAPLPAQVLDARGRVLYWNSLAESVTGYAVADLLGNASPIAVEHPRPGYWARENFTLSHKNGGRLEILAFTAPLSSSGPERYLSLFADMTKDQLAAEQVEQRAISFRALVEQASDLLAILDRNSTIQYINPAVESLLGIRPEALAGASAADLIEEIPAAGDPLQLRMRHFDGSTRELSGTILPIADTSLLLLAARPEQSVQGILSNLDIPILTLDRDHHVISLNPAAGLLFGLDETAVGRSLSQLLPDWLQSPSRDHISARIEETGSFAGEVSFYTPSGRELVLQVSMARTSDGSRIVALYRDVTATRPAAEALSLDDTERTLNLISSTEGLWDWNLLTGEVYFSPRWKEMLGYDAEAIAPVPDAWFAVVHPDDLPGLRHRLDAYLRGQQAHLEIEYRARLADGQYRWMLSRAVAVRSETGEARRLVGLQTDVHNQKQRDEELLFEAFHDSVTGLENRALFLDRLEGILLRQTMPVTLAFLDIEAFSNVNRELGARGGDKALAAIGRRLRDLVPPGSHIARHGSDEFLVLLPVVDPERLDALKLLWQSRLAAPIAWQGREVSLHVRVGFALASELPPEASAEAMLQAATRHLAGSAEPGDPPELPDFPVSQFRVF